MASSSTRVEDLAAQYGVSRATIFRWRAQGRLPPTPVRVQQEPIAMISGADPAPQQAPAPERDPLVLPQQVSVDGGIRWLQAHGVRISESPGREAPEPTAQAQVAPAVGGWHSFALVGDIHFGSRWCRHDYLADFCARAHARGCRLFLQVGDLLDGEYRHGIRELRAAGFDAQADEAIALLPRLPDSHWYFIDGNHDETFTRAAGVTVGRAVVERAQAVGRTDLHFLGQRRGLLLLDSGCKYQPLVELWHPLSSPAYATSYHLQRRIAAYEPGHKPDFLLVGHWHRSCYLVERGIHAFAAGCWQGGGSAFSNALGAPPALGSWIVSYSLTDQGTLRHVAAEWVAYYEDERARTHRFGAPP